MKGLNNTPLFLFLGITVLQWVLISYLLHERYTAGECTNDTRPPQEHPLPLPVPKILSEKSAAISTLDNSPTEYPGVAAAIFFSAPAWFHRRFPVLIQNVLGNIPSDWAVQLFVHPAFWNEKVLPWHPGLPRLLQQNSHRILVTELPNHMWNLPQPNQRIPLDEWFWNQLVADKVLMFSGNGILCTHGNTPENWDTITRLDFLGTPWARLGKVGGDGSTHSFRNRKLMLQALEYAKQHNLKIELPESQFFVSTLKKMMVDSKSPVSDIKLATPLDTILFGGVRTTNSTITGAMRPIPPPPMVISGTQPQLSFQEREDLLLVCPELKVIFPSMHEPSCFGADPDPERCKATICALRDPLPSSGC